MGAITSVPFDYALSPFVPDNTTLRSLKLIRVARLLRLAKLLRLGRLAKAWSNIEERLHIPAASTRLVKLLCQVTWACFPSAPAHALPTLKP